MSLYTRHAAERAWERYGIILNDKVAEELVGMINNGRYRRIWPVRHVMHYELEYAGKLLCVVYDLTNRKIVTLQPPDALGPKKQRKKKAKHSREKRVLNAYA